MSHPTPDELSAFHDGLLKASALFAVENHLDQCAECRDALADLARQDKALAATLAHDPGDAHFERLAARIDKRIATEARGAPATVRETGDAKAAAPRRGALAILRAALGGMRAPHWAGAAAALVVGAGLVFLQLRQGPGLALRDRALEQRTRQTADSPREDDRARESRPGAGADGSDGGRAALSTPAPSPAPPPAMNVTPPPAGNVTPPPWVTNPAPPPPPAAGSAAPDVAQEPAPSATPSSPPTAGATSSETTRRQDRASTRARELKRLPSGEDVPVGKREGFAKAPPPQRPVEEQEKPAAKLKSLLAQPMDKGSTRSEPAPASGAKTEPAPPPSAGAAAAAADRKEVVPPPAPGAAGAEYRFAAPPAIAPAPVSGVSKSDEAASVRVCGRVTDTLGRPVPTASVTLATLGRGTSTDSDGRFCIDAPPGEHALSVIAVGFQALRRDVSFAQGSAALALTLDAVQVLAENPRVTALRGGVLRGAPQTGSPGDAKHGPTDTQQGPGAQAMRLTLAAEREKSAPRYEAAAAEWERVRQRSAGTAFELEARFRIAEARYRAWELAPSPKRAAAANEALTGFLVRAPFGPHRNLASAWLGRVKS